MFFAKEPGTPEVYRGWRFYDSVVGELLESCIDDVFDTRDRTKCIVAQGDDSVVISRSKRDSCES